MNMRLNHHSIIETVLSGDRKGLEIMAFDSMKTEPLKMSPSG